MKKLCLFMCAMCTGLMLTGVSAGAEEEDLLKEVEEANTLDAMVSKYGRVGYTVTQTSTDGTESVFTLYQDDTWYVVEDETGILVDENGDVYGSDYEADTSYRYLFIGDTYEDFCENSEYVSFFTYSENEQITSEEVIDDLLYLETTMDCSESDLEWFSEFGFEEGEVDSEFTEYVIDEETKEILELRSYVVSGEEKILFAETILDKEPEEYTLDEELSENIFGEDSRTLSVITDAGTDDEATYTQTVTKGSSIALYFEGVYDDTYYADPECTEVMEVDPTEDATIYLKRIEDADL
ncbi:MAG: hypothetical protein LUF78_12250 [Clostridiales bacterium]|nr:hypothetical protein [Clostridiales bacterium]